MVTVTDELGPSKGPSCIDIPDEHLRNVLEWLNKLDTELVMPYEDGETNTGNHTKMHGFTISTEYHSNGDVEIGFRTKDGLIVTTKEKIEKLIKNNN